MMNGHETITTDNLREDNERLQAENERLRRAVEALRAYNRKLAAQMDKDVYVSVRAYDVVLAQTAILKKARV